jgi:hypothetical protein
MEDQEELKDQNIMTEHTESGEPILIDTPQVVVTDLLKKLDLVPDQPMSRYLSEISTDHRNGEVVSKTMKLITILNNILSPRGIEKPDYIEGAEIYKEFIESMDYQFHDKKVGELTNEEVDEINKKYNDFISKKNVFVPDYAIERAIENLKDIISQFTNNNDPYEFIVFIETFNPEIFITGAYRSEYMLKEYEFILNHPVVKQKLESYDRWKDLISNLDFRKKNKYKVANYFECLDASLKQYEQIYSVEIYDKGTCLSFLHPILNEMHDELNLWDLVEKYHMVTHRQGSLRNPKYGDIFIEQYLRPFRIKNEIKLF